MGCNEDTTSFDNNDEVAHFRIINIIEYYSNVAIWANQNKFIDTLFCNQSSGYIDILTDSLNIQILDNTNNQIIFDTLCYIKDRFYTLFLVKKNNSVSSLLVRDIQLTSTECSFMRIFNNSSAGEPFIFSIISQIDSISFVGVPLNRISTYQLLLDTLYTPSLNIISSGETADYDLMSIERNKQYLVVITDTYPIEDAWYPYVVIVFEDISVNENTIRLL